MLWRYVNEEYGSSFLLIESFGSFSRSSQPTKTNTLKKLWRWWTTNYVKEEYGSSFLLIESFGSFSRSCHITKESQITWKKSTVLPFCSSRVLEVLAALVDLPKTMQWRYVSEEYGSSFLLLRRVLEVLAALIDQGFLIREYWAWIKLISWKKSGSPFSCKDF